MKYRVVRAFRSALAMTLVVVMLLTQTAFAAQGVLTLPSMMQVIEEEAFMGDTSVEHVVIPEGTSSIGARAFADCTALHTVEIPDSVGEIGEEAFAGCPAELVIVCSRESYAAQYAEKWGLNTDYTDAMFIGKDNRFNTFYLDSEEGQNDCWLANGYLENCDLEEGQYIDWSIGLTDHSGDVPVADVYLADSWDNNRGINLYCGKRTGDTGWVEYAVTAVVTDGETEYASFTETYTFHFEYMPEEYFTDEDLIVPDTDYHIEAGDTFDFLYSDITLNNAGDTEWQPEIHSIEQIEQLPGIDWEAVDGFRVTFEQNGRYRFQAAIKLAANYFLRKEIYVTVGDGVSPDMSADWNIYSTEMYLHHGDMWVADVSINNYTPPRGCEIEWNVSLNEGQENVPVELYLADVRDEGYTAGLCARQLTDEATGEAAYTVTATVGEEIIEEREITVKISALPEGMPESIWAEPAVYTIEPGSEFVFSDESFGLYEDSYVPEGAGVEKQIWLNPSIEERRDFEWIDGGFRATFDEPGRYAFTVAVKINNYPVTHDIVIFVGEGPVLNVEYDSTDVFVDRTGETYMATFWLENFHQLDGEAVGWRIERISEDGSPFENVYLWIEDAWEESWYATMWADQPIGTTGEVTYRVTAVQGDGEYSWSKDITLRVVDRPEDLPDTLDLPAYSYDLQVGDTLELKTSDIVMADFTGMENFVCSKSYRVVDEMLELPGFEWTEDGLRVTFTEPGRYLVRPVVCITANYYVYENIVITVGDGGLSEAVITGNPNMDTVYYPEYGEAWLGGWDLNNYAILVSDDVEWTLERQTDENSPAEPIVDAYVSWISDDRTRADVSSREPREVTGTEIYALICKVNGEEVARCDVTIHVEEAPEDMPSELWVESGEYWVNPGEWFEFTYDMFGAADLPEWASEYKEICTQGDLDQQNGFEWTENGFKVCVDHDGRYSFEAVSWIGNNRIGRNVVLYVGSGESDFYVEWDDHAFQLFRGYGSAWVTDAHIYDYIVPADCEIEWKAELAEGQEQFVQLDIVDVWDDGMSAGFHAYPVSDRSGENTFIITARAGDELIIEREITIQVGGLPDNMPTELWVEQEEYYLQPGDTLDINGDMYGNVDGDPQGCVWKEIYLGDLTWSQQVEMHAWDHFTITFNDEGRYDITVSLNMNNYVLTRQIRVIVGDGVYDGTEVNASCFIDTVYVGEGVNDSCYAVDASLNNYTLFEGESIEWEIRPVGEANVMGAEIEYINEENPRQAGFRLKNISEVGSATFEVIARTPDGKEYTDTFTVNAVELPEGMPTDFNLNLATEYSLGDEMVFTADCIELLDGDPAVYGEPMIWENIGDAGMWDENDCWWHEDELHAVFRTENAYEVTFTAAFGNYEINKAYVFTIGDGVRNDVDFRVQHEVSTLYTDGEDCVWVASAWLDNYNRLSDEEYEWTLELIDGSGNNPVELYIDNYDNDGANANIHTRNLTGEEGWAQYRLTLTTGRSQFSGEIWINVENRPEDMATELELEDEVYHFEIGDTLYMHTNNFGANGWIPEDAYICDEFWIGENTFGGEEVIWGDDGDFSVTFTKDGRYVFTAVKWVNNVTVTREVSVYVGSGLAENASVKVDQRFNTGFAYPEDENNPLQHFVAQVRLEGYELANDEGIEWKLEQVSPAEGENMPVELVIDYTEWNGEYANISTSNFTGETGSVTYRVVANTEAGVQYTGEITYTVLEAPDNLPTEITGVETEVHLNPGDTYTFDGSLVGFAGGEVPEGVEYYLEYFSGMDYLEFMPGFEWREDGGFSVTFPRDGYFEFEANLRIGTNHYVGTTVHVTIGEGIANEPSLSVNKLSDYVIVENGGVGPMFEVYLNNYEPYEGENMLWEIERIGGSESAVELYFDEIRDNDTTAALYAGVGSGETGESTFRVHITTESGYRDFVEYTVRAISWPESMPGDIWLDDMSIPVGEEFTFLPGEHVQMNGSLPEDHMYHYEIRVDDLLANTEGFDLRFNGTTGTYDSFVFTPEAENRYQVTVTLWLGNWSSTDSFVLNVGDGLADDVCVSWTQRNSTVYLFEGCNDVSYAVGRAVLENYNLMDGEQVRWNIERVDENGGNPVEIGMNDFNETVSLYFENIQETGSVTYRLTVETDAGFTDSCDVTLSVQELPEDMPTGIVFTLPTHYELGETMEFTVDDIVFVDGVVPEDCTVNTVTWDLVDGEIWNANDSEFITGGYRITFTQNGRYKFGIERRLGNYNIYADVEITVGTGVSDHAGIDLHLNTDRIYTEQDGGWIGDVCLANYQLFGGETVEWKLEALSETDYAGVHLGGSWEDGLWVNIHTLPTGRAEGHTDYRLTAVTGAGYTFTCDFGVDVVSLPDEMPENLISPWIVQANIGEEYEFVAEDLMEPDCWPSDGNNLVWTVDPEERLMQTDGFWWTERGFVLCPSEDGRYDVWVRAWIGNRGIERRVVLRAGDGLADDVHVDWDEPVDTVYLDGDGSALLAVGTLTNFTFAENEEVNWWVERLDGGDDPAAEFWTEGSGNYCELYAGNISHTGTVSARVYVSAPDGYEDSFDFTLNVEETPENMPSSLTFEESEYHLNPGDTLSFNWSQVSFADGQVPEGASVRYSLPDLENRAIWQENDSRWTDNGFEITFGHNGRYEFDVHAAINGYTVGGQIHVYVGTGIRDDVYVDWVQYVDTVYAGIETEGFIGNGYIRNYEMFSGESIWHFERVDEECTSSAELHHGDFSHGVDVNAMNTAECTTGRLKYVLSAQTEAGFEWSQDVVVNVENLPGNLPTQLALEQDTYEFTVGDEFDFHYGDIDFADGEVPEDAYLRNWLGWADEEQHRHFWDDNEVIWYSLDRFHVRFHTPGEYQIILTRTINNYAIERTVTFIVKEEEPYIDLNAPLNTFFLGAEPIDNWICDASLRNIELGEGETVEWNWMPIDLEEGEEPIAVFMGTNEWNGGLDKRFEYSEFIGTGESAWCITATVGENIWSAEVRFTVADLPENMPTALALPREIYIGRNELFMFNRNDIGPENGEIPEGVNTESYLWNLEESIEHQPGFCWTEDGFQVSFGDDGRHRFTAVLYIGNYQLTQDVWITVGDGVSNETVLNTFEAANTLYMDYGDMWVLDASVDNYTLLNEGEVWWSLDLAEGCDNPAVELYLGDGWDDGRCMNVFARQTSEEPGSATYVLTAHIGDMWEQSREITVYLEELPENMPAVLDMGDTAADVQLNVGDSFEFHAAGIGFGEGEVPEGAFVRYELWDLHEGIEQLPEFHYFEENSGVDDAGFSAVFENAGRYSFYVVRKINNYAVTEEIRITVGEIDMDSVYLDNGQQTGEVYTDSDGMWLGWWSLNNFRLFDSDEVDWKLERIIDENSPEEPAAQLEITDWWEDRQGVNVYCHGTGSEVGTERYRIACVVNGEVIASDEIEVTVVQKPDDLPTSLNMGDIPTTIYLNQGDAFEFHANEIWFGEGTVPEGAYVRYELWDLDMGIEHQAEFEPFEENDGRDDSGFRVRFYDHGQYGFRVIMRINNYIVSEKIRIFVGEWDEPYLDNDQQTAELYTNNNSIWLGWWRLNDYDLYYYDDVNWTIERITDENSPEEPVVGLEISGWWENRDGVDVQCFDTGEATGTERYRIACIVNGEEIASDEIEVTVVEQPENLPAGLTVSEPHIQLNPGDAYVFHLSDIGFDGGEIPESAHVGFWTDMDEQALGVDWSEDRTSFTLHVNEPGWYYFNACAGINNYMLNTPVTIEVGEFIEWNQEVYELYAGVSGTEGTVGIGSAFMNNYWRQDGENAEWSFERTGDDNVTAEMFRYEEDWFAGANLHCTNIGEEKGTVTWTVTVTTDAGFTASHDFVLNVVDLPESFPTSLTVPSGTEHHLTVGDTYELHTSEFVFDADVPEGATLTFGHMEEIPNHEWIDEEGGACVKITFDEAGEYRIAAMMMYSNYTLYTPIRFYVTE